MYVPAHFSAEEPDALIGHLARRGAAALVTVDPDGTPIATHLPVLWDAERRVVTGHIARANTQWTHGASRALVILTGAEAYISPSWYPSKAETGKVVPTWNYEAVHLSGDCAWFDDTARLEAIVRDLTSVHEQDMAQPWSIEDAPRPYVEALLRGIVGVTIQVDRVEAKRKASQNKDARDYAGVADGLSGIAEPGAQDMAAIMRARQTSKP